MNEKRQTQFDVQYAACATLLILFAICGQSFAGSGPTTRYITSSGRGKDTRAIPGWDLRNRERRVDLCWWTPATNSYANDDARIAKWAHHAVKAGCPIALFDVETAGSDLERRIAIARVIRAAEPKLKILFYPTYIGRDPSLGTHVQPWIYPTPANRAKEERYARRQEELFRICGAVLIVAQPMRPDDWSAFADSIAFQSSMCDRFAPGILKVAILCGEYNWEQMSVAAPTKQNPNNRIYPVIAQIDCERMMRACDTRRIAVLAFQPWLITNELPIEPFYYTFLRNYADLAK